MKRLLLAATLISFVTGIVAPLPASAAVLDRTEERCMSLEERLDTAAENAGTTYNEHRQTYHLISDRATTIIKRLKTTDYDTAKLEAAHAKIKTESDTFAASARALTSSIESAKSQMCTGTNSLDSVLAPSRAALKKTRESSQAVRQTYRTEYIPALTDAAAWLKQNPGKTVIGGN